MQSCWRSSHLLSQPHYLCSPLVIELFFFWRNTTRWRWKRREMIFKHIDIRNHIFTSIMHHSKYWWSFAKQPLTLSYTDEWTNVKCRITHFATDDEHDSVNWFNGSISTLASQRHWIRLDGANEAPPLQSEGIKFVIVRKSLNRFVRVNGRVQSAAQEIKPFYEPKRCRMAWADISNSKTTKIKQNWWEGLVMFQLKRDNLSVM